tara:strand:- start:10 stop:150 length:141 start_codon:yes stop_codon:yes gene_type:complete
MPSLYQQGQKSEMDPTMKVKVFYRGLVENSKQRMLGIIKGTHSRKP